MLSGTMWKHAGGIAICSCHFVSDVIHSGKKAYHVLERRLFEGRAQRLTSIGEIINLLSEFINGAYDILTL